MQRLPVLFLCAILSICVAWHQNRQAIRHRCMSHSNLCNKGMYDKQYFASKSNHYSLLHTTKLKAAAESSSRNSQEGQEVEKLLLAVIDPDTKQVLDKQRVQSIDIAQNGNIAIRIKYPAGKTSASEELKKLLILQLSMLSWVNEIQIVFVNDVVETTSSSSGSRSSIKHTIAVSSCKGGVGKSTTSVNLAYSLKQQGFRVGILDADIFGPSLPTMTKPDLSNPVIQGQSFIPPEYDGVKLMSMGFINRGASIMRGPMVNQVLNQLISLTKWGDLDYLIIDMPPGTGDIQLTLAQALNISAAVIVTTPQRLSFVDVVKGIDMFDTVNVPAIAVVENMASFSSYDFTAEFYDTVAKDLLATTNGNSVERIASQLQALIESRKVQKRIFGDGFNEKLKSMWGIENIISLPLVEDISQCGDKGTPFVLQYPQSDVAKVYQSLAKTIVNEVATLAASNPSQISSVTYDTAAKGIAINHGAGGMIDSKALRCECKCAVCVEELTGRKLLNDDTIPATIKPLAMAPIGRYAWSIDWSDGHKSLYPFKQLAALAQSKATSSV